MDIFLRSISGILVILGMILVGFVIGEKGWFDDKSRGLLAKLVTIFVGLPINQALFGDASIPYVLIYYMCNTTFFWTLGTYLIQRDGEGEAQFDLKTSLKKVFSPPLMGFLLGLVLVMLQIKLPAFLASDLQYLGNLTTPLSMIFIGLLHS